jgi:hypothetical protein
MAGAAVTVQAVWRCVVLNAIDVLCRYEPVGQETGDNQWRANCQSWPRRLAGVLVCVWYIGNCACIDTCVCTHEHVWQVAKLIVELRDGSVPLHNPITITGVMIRLLSGHVCSYWFEHTNAHKYSPKTHGVSSCEICTQMTYFCVGQSIWTTFATYAI